MHTAGPQTILLVEDEAIVSTATALEIRKWGYKVIPALSGEESLKIIQDGTKVHLVLMDIDLGGGMDGTEAARQILAVAAIPIVFLTSHAEREMVEKVRGLTRYGYVIKDSGDFVLRSSIEMAFELFEANRSLERNMQILRESEAKFRRLTENAADLIYRMSLPGGKYEYVSPASVQMTGYAPEDFYRGRIHVSELIHPDYQEYFKQEWDELMAGRMSLFYEYTIIHADGGKRWFHQRNVLVRDEDGSPVAIEGIVSDVTENKQAEDLFKRGEERLRNIINGANVGTWEWNVQTGEAPFDEKSASILGYSLDELQPIDIEGWMRLKHPDDMAASNELLAKHLRGETEYYSFESRMKHKNGNWVWVLGRGKTIEWDRDGKPLRMFGTHLDITERKQMEEELRFQASILDQIGDLVTVTDLDGRIVYVNEAQCKVFGKTRDALIGKATDIYGEDPGQGANQNEIRESTLRDGAWRGEVVNFDGYGNRMVMDCRTWKMLDSFGNSKALIGISTNITERKHLEEERHKSEKKYRQLYESIMDAIILLDMEGMIIYANTTFQKMLGFSIGELVLMSNADITPEIWHDMEKNTQAEQVLKRGYSDTYEKEYRRKDGSACPVEVRVFLLKDDDDRPRSMWAIVRDISSRKLAEQKIGNLLAEKELILKEVHHRIKNNMGTIKSLLYLQAGSLKDRIAVEALEDAGSRVQGMLVLYDKLYQSVKFSEISMREYLPELVDQIIDNFPDGAAVNLEVDVCDFVLDVNRIQTLGIIVNELVTNIMKYAFKGRDDGLINLSATHSGNRIAVIIRDNGNGMPEAVDFENSTGFGLMLVGALTNQMEGTVRIERGNGTKIILEFGV